MSRSIGIDSNGNDVRDYTGKEMMKIGDFFTIQLDELWNFKLNYKINRPTLAVFDESDDMRGDFPVLLDKYHRRNLKKISDYSKYFEVFIFHNKRKKRWINPTPIEIVTHIVAHELTDKSKEYRVGDIYQSSSWNVKVHRECEEDERV